MSNGPHFVYVLAVGPDDGPLARPVKIGMTSDLDARLCQIRPCSPLPLAYAFTFQFSCRRIALMVERLAHENADYDRLDYEWFNLDPSHAAEIVREATLQMEREHVEAA